MSKQLSIKGWGRRGDMMATHHACVCKLLPCYTGFGDQLKDDQQLFLQLLLECGSSYIRVDKASPYWCAEHSSIKLCHVNLNIYE